jgi:hypothetical protein
MPPLLEEAKLLHERVGGGKGGQTPKDEPGSPLQLLRAVRQQVVGRILGQPTLQTFPGEPITKEKDLGKTLV